MINLCKWILITHLLIAGAANARTFIVGYIPFPGLSYTDENKMAQGEGIDFVRESFKKLDIDYKLIEYPPKRLYRLINDGEIDFTVGPNGIPPIEKNIISTKKAIYCICVNSYRMSSAPKISSLKDLNGKRVGVFGQYTYIGILNYLKDAKNSIKLHRVTNRSSAIAQLKNNRIDYLIEYKSNIEAMKIDTLKIKSDTLKTVDSFVLGVKSKKDVQNVINRINAL